MNRQVPVSFNIHKTDYDYLLKPKNFTLLFLRKKCTPLRRWEIIMVITIKCEIQQYCEAKLNINHSKRNSKTQVGLVRKQNPRSISGSSGKHYIPTRRSKNYGKCLEGQENVYSKCT